MVEGATHPVVNGSFDVVVEHLERGRNRIRVEVVDPAGNARVGEGAVRHGSTWLGAGPVTAAVAGAVAARWVAPGRRRGRDRHE